MSQPTEALKSCLECGADNVLFADRCWMCRGDLQNAPVIAVLVAQEAKPGWARSEPTSLILVAALAGLVVLVGIGVYASEPGLVIPFAIVVAPALLATFLRATRKNIQGKPLGILETIATFIISGLVVLGILFLLVIALIVGLIVYCFAELARH